LYGMFLAKMPWSSPLNTRCMSATSPRGTYITPTRLPTSVGNILCSFGAEAMKEVLCRALDILIRLKPCLVASDVEVGKVSDKLSVELESDELVDDRSLSTLGLSTRDDPDNDADKKGLSLSKPFPSVFVDIAELKEERLIAFVLLSPDGRLLEEPVILGVLVRFALAVRRFSRT